MPYAREPIYIYGMLSLPVYCESKPARRRRMCTLKGRLPIREMVCVGKRGFCWPKGWDSSENEESDVFSKTETCRFEKYAYLCAQRKGALTPYEISPREGDGYSKSFYITYY